jgi:DNA-binding MarR family transcriptional regulator
VKPPVAVPSSTETRTRPKALDDVIGFQLRRAHNLFALHWQQCFREQAVRITPVQGGILLVIDNQPGLSQTALASIMDVEGPTLVQTLERMEDAGLILRNRRAEDRRSYSLELTKAGREALTAVRAVVPHREAELLSDLTERERVLLLGLLKRVVGRAQVVIDSAAAGPGAKPPGIESKKVLQR